MSSGIFFRFRAYLIVSVLLLPMFWIGIRDTHDWGDDFAAFLQQADNLTHHRPLNASKYVAFDHYSACYAPPSVPPGFALLLSPVIKVFGMNFKALNYYMSFWLYLFALISFAFLIRYISVLSATCLVLIFFLNPAMIDFKSNVISDLPFCFFSTWAILIHLDISKKNKITSQLLYGAVVALVVSIRGIGVCIIAAYGIDLIGHLIGALIERQRKRDIVSYLMTRCVWFISFVLVYVLIILLSGYSAGSTFSFYKGAYQGIHMWEVMMGNLNIYIQDFFQMFDMNVGIYGFGLVITKSAMLSCLIIGFFIAVVDGYGLILAYFLVYSAAILLFPFSTQGFRYFFPVLPIVMLFIAFGARRIVPADTSVWRPLWVMSVTLLIFLQYKTDLLSMHTHQSEPIYPTPVSAECMSGFAHIKNMTSDSDLILSLKPRACALWADRRFCVIPDGNGAAEQSKRLSISKPDLILVIKQIDMNKLEGLAAYEKDSLIYEDGMFKLYKRRL
jgi:hypothetical protein